MSIKSSSVALLLSFFIVAGCNAGKIVDPAATAPSASTATTAPPSTAATGSSSTISGVTSASTAPATSSATTATGPLTASFAPTGQAHDLEKTIVAELD
jgi:hypothetical protein